VAFTTPLAAQDQLPPAPYAYKQLADPAPERKAQVLMETLRCLKCQSQAISDSDAPMAGDMRHQVRTPHRCRRRPRRSASGRSNATATMSAIPRKFVRITWPLFAAPVVLILAVAAFLLRGRFRRGEPVMTWVLILAIAALGFALRACVLKLPRQRVGSDRRAALLFGDCGLRPCRAILGRLAPRARRLKSAKLADETLLKERQQDGLPPSARDSLG